MYFVKMIACVCAFLVPAEPSGVIADHLLVGRLIDAVGPHEPLVIDDDMAVLPRDLREVLLGELTRTTADGRHLILSDLKVADNQVARHGRGCYSPASWRRRALSFAL